MTDSDDSKAFCIGKNRDMPKGARDPQDPDPFSIATILPIATNGCCVPLPLFGIPPSFAYPQRKEKHFRPLTSWAYPITMQGESLSELFRFVNPL